nr:hypothetical protein CFP56_25025 [Quercus suber]
MRCRLEEHCCWCSCGLIQGSHEYAQWRGRLYYQCSQVPLPLGGVGQRALHSMLHTSLLRTKRRCLYYRQSRERTIIQEKVEDVHVFLQTEN